MIFLFMVEAHGFAHVLMSGVMGLVNRVMRVALRLLAPPHRILILAGGLSTRCGTVECRNMVLPILVIMDVVHRVRGPMCSDVIFDRHLCGFWMLRTTFGGAAVRFLHRGNCRGAP